MLFLTSNLARVYVDYSIIIRASFVPSWLSKAAILQNKTYVLLEPFKKLSGWNNRNADRILHGFSVERSQHAHAQSSFPIPSLLTHNVDPPTLKSIPKSIPKSSLRRYSHHTYSNSLPRVSSGPQSDSTINRKPKSPYDIPVICPSNPEKLHIPFHCA